MLIKRKPKKGIPANYIEIPANVKSDSFYKNVLAVINNVFRPSCEKEAEFCS